MIVVDVFSAALPPSACGSTSQQSLIPFVSGCDAGSESVSGVVGRRQTQACDEGRNNVDGPVLLEAPPLFEETLMDVREVKNVQLFLIRHE